MHSSSLRLTVAILRIDFKQAALQVISFKKENISLYIHAANGINSDKTASTISKHPY
ncbi:MULTISPECIES: hypothetical protein [unclassified Neochlamydia]|uniref:hypothetical protein n=1 Tax=unclassified Neochlamydia TaxID=2643326 RepID=UPI00140B57EC|nr:MULTISPECIES: hypothetical protein [unclassified Neochlamydia]NGY94579.1 hypothetical protein [Neochlamydia sp. AcF84]